MRKLLSHYVCETCIIDNTWCCKLLFPKHVISHFSPMCYSALTNVHKAISQSYKIVCVCISLQAPPIERARAPVSALLWKWVTNCVLESMDFKVLQFKNSIHPRRTSSLGSGLNPSLLQLKLRQDSEYNIKIIIVWYWYYIWSDFGESYVTMDDIYVVCMLFSTVMLTSFFHLCIIVYLTNKYFTME